MIRKPEQWIEIARLTFEDAVPGEVLHRVEANVRRVDEDMGWARHTLSRMRRASSWLGW